MEKKEIDVLGVSNVLMDICALVEEKLLIAHNLKKGNFHLVETHKFMEILPAIEKLKPKVEFGSSVSNTLAGLYLLGMNIAEYGKIGDDKYGNMLLEEERTKKAVKLLIKHSLPTGTVLNMITPDTQRTFAVYYGAAAKLNESEISEETVKKSRIFHTTGYEFESLNKVVKKAASLAKKNNVKVSFDLADPGVVKRNIEDMKKFIHEYVNIIFANEDEAKAFTGMAPEEAVKELSNTAEFAIVKLGSNGSLISHKGKIIKISAEKANAIDTTGAGDMYAAGILYGIIKGFSMEKAGRIASYAAARVVEKIGARLEKLDISHIN